MNRWWNNPRTDSTPSDTTNPGGTPMTTTTPQPRILNPLIGKIPAELDRQTVFTALHPLLDLLGISPDDFYATPGITISPVEVAFSIPAHYPPVQLGTHGHRLLEAEARITVPLTPHEVDGLTFQRVAAEIREGAADSTRPRRICEPGGEASCRPTAEAIEDGPILVRSGWRHITGEGDCYFCEQAAELVAAYGIWDACHSCYVAILPSCQP